MTDPAIGIALGSGVARGWAHIGVMKVLHDAGLRPKIVSGTSIGALVGGFYLAGQIDALDDWARGLTRLNMLSYLDVKLGGGMVGGERLNAEMRNVLGDMLIEDLDRTFAVVCTHLSTGHEVWIRHGGLVEAMRASFALPGVFRPVKTRGRWMVDGALTNPVPISACRGLGADIVIAVNLNTDVSRSGRAEHPERGTGPTDPADPDEEGFAAFIVNPISTIGPRPKPAKSEPRVLDTMVSSLLIMQDRITRARLAGDPPDIGVNPRLGSIGVLEFHRAEELIARGEAAARAALPDISATLKAWTIRT